MSTIAEVEGLIRNAEIVISADGNTFGLYDSICDAIYDCPSLGNLDEKNKLMLQVDYYLEQWYRHTIPAPQPLHVISSMPVPEAPEITWRQPGS